MNTTRPRTSESATPCRSVLLISSTNVNWVGLRTNLRAQRNLRIVAEVRQADEVLPTVTKVQPAVIFVPVKLEGASIVPIIAQVHTRCPALKVIVLGDELDHDELLKLGQAGIDSYL